MCTQNGYQNMKKLTRVWDKNRIVETLATIGYDPLTAIIHIARGMDADNKEDDRITQELRFKANLTLLEYLVPKPKAVELKVENTAADEARIAMMKNLSKLIEENKKDY